MVLLRRPLANDAKLHRRRYMNKNAGDPTKWDYEPDLRPPGLPTSDPEEAPTRA